MAATRDARLWSTNPATSIATAKSAHPIVYVRSCASDDERKLNVSVGPVEEKSAISILTRRKSRIAPPAFAIGRAALNSATSFAGRSDAATKDAAALTRYV